MKTDPQSNVKASAESSGQPKSMGRRLFHWIVGLFVAGVAAALTAFITGQLQPFVDSASAGLADIKCHLLSKTPRKDDKRLLVLISPLAGDDSKATQTDRLLGAFRGQDVNAYTACERIAFDPRKDKDSSQREVAQASTALLKKYGADVLMFGEVGLADKAARVWLVNETGGCEEQPSSIVFENGFPPPSAGLAPKISEKIFGAMVSAVLAACKATQTDWKGLEHRTRKVGLYLQRVSNSNKSELTSSGTWAYATVLKLLYQNEDRKEWYETSTAFNLDRANRVFAQDPKNRALWLAMQADIEAERYYKSNDEAAFDAAIGYIDEAIMSDADPDYYMARGLMFFRGKENALAISDFSTVIRLQPKKTEAFIERGKVRRFNGQLDAAMADFNVAISQDPKDGEAFLERGVAWRNKGQYETAIKDYDTAIQLAPDSALAYASRGYVRSRFLDDPRKALSDFNEAIRLAPKNPDWLGGRGETLYKLKEYDRALADFNEAIRLAPKDPARLGQRGEFFYDLNEYDRAIADYSAAIRLAPEHGPYYTGRARAWQYKQDNERALADFERAMHLGEKDPNSYTLRGLAYFKLGRYEESASDFGSSVALAPDYPYAHLWWYLSLSHARHGPNATTTLSNGYSKIDQKVWPAAIFELLLGRLNSAEVLKLAGEANNPEDKQARLCEAQFYLGEYRRIAGRDTEAIQHFQNARDSCPHDFREYGLAIAELKRMAR